MKHRMYINQSFGYKGSNIKIDGVSDSYKKGRSVGYRHCNCEIGKDHEVEYLGDKSEFQRGWDEAMSVKDALRSKSGQA